MSTTTKPAPRWVANLSLLFTELPLLDRPAAAAAEGFDAIEYWWPFGTSGRPSSDEVDAFIAAVDDAGVSLVAMNLFAGDMPAGERGVLSYPERTQEFRDSVAVAVEVGRRLGTRMFNAPYGHRREGLDPEVQNRVGDDNLAFAATELGAVGGVVLLEPVSRMPLYSMKSAADAFAIRDRLHARGITNVEFLLDQYHLAMNGEDVLALIAEHTGDIAHVQLADIPNRGEPGSGEGAVGPAVEALLAAGYDGLMALEYIPTTNTADSLAAWRRDATTWSAPAGL
ncbi:TIM barrel protein [Leucobacter weissii]|uniref:TIM barrel protein n=1 Tax=Leucobacter weissii TaxID=1983706 RepID=A0A939MMF2_9MICO|nr:TIM barrel protein [Leucobacter weissii]MBO1903241.1 TIM barrel protein [Leucobacter weissii]